MKGFGTLELRDRAESGAEHFVQLFDDPESLADVLSSFAAEGLAGNEVVLLIAAHERWVLTAKRLAILGIDIERAVDTGQLTVWGTAETLARFWRAGRPNEQLFEASVGALVRALLARGKRLRVYCDMVDLLAAEGDFSGAAELENFWNRLCARETFTLFCGYMAVNFGDSRTADALRTICALHSEVRVNQADMLGSFLVRASVSGGPLDGQARR